MATREIKFSNQISEEQVSSVLNKNLDSTMTDWFEFQAGWLNRAYNTFKDFDKYLIILYFVNKTFKSYSELFIKKTFNEFYDLKKFEIQKFNIIDIANDLSISKETARRKVLELEKSAILQKSNKAIILNQNSLSVQKPNHSVHALSRFFSNFSKKLYAQGYLKKEFHTKELEERIKENFTPCWSHYFDFQIPQILTWKKFYNNDTEIFYIIAILIYNQNLNMRNFGDKSIGTKYDNYNWLNKLIISGKNTRGVNAMSISDMTGIPRPTVLRKLKHLMSKNKYISKDRNNFYYLSHENSNFINQLNNERILMMERLSKMIVKFFNLFGN